MVNKGRLVVAVCVALATSSCSKQPPPDGFKDLKYGMSLAELRARGFDCQPDDISCTRPSSSAKERDTLFGKEADIYVRTSGGHLAGVNVGVDMTIDELIDLFTQEFGKPKVFAYRSLGGRAEKNYWLSRSNTAVVVTKGRQSSVFGVPRATAGYLGPAETKSLLGEAAADSIRKGDF